MVSRNPAAAIHPGFAAVLCFALSTALISAPIISPSSADTQEREATAQKFVGHALGVWQDRLNLKDWQIHVELVRPTALEPRTLGNIHWNTDTKRATIDVLSAYDYTLPMPQM